MPVVYVSSSRSLAALEMAVHLDRTTLLSSFVLISCEFDERLVTVVAPDTLPIEWRRDPPPPELAQIGDTWAKTAESAVLAVPSAIVNDETNFLLNPVHPDFSQIRIGEPGDFAFDRRLIE